MSVVMESAPYNRVAALQRIVAQDREIILDLREKLARAEQERDAALLLIESMQRECGVTEPFVPAMIG